MNMELISQIFLTVVLIGVAIAAIPYFLSDTIKDLLSVIREGKRAANSEIMPIAECFCKDCVHYKVENGVGRCQKGHIDKYCALPGMFFCAEAKKK